ncbi:MAG: hypothetical protein PHQ35_10155 [Phycisphaerae bacterium]|nr:hypothetical protein [Phycisphaerae bacterium]MDD5381946.1 hypothetical protein [Phycisphaerae bacterium]
MDKRQIQLVRDICHEVDWLVTQDQGTAELDVLERYRLKMNDLLWKRKYREAEDMAYAILLKRAGHDADRYLSE